MPDITKQSATTEIAEVGTRKQKGAKHLLML